MVEFSGKEKGQASFQSIASLEKQSAGNPVLCP